MLRGQMNPGRSRINPGWILHPVYHPYFCSYPSLSFQIERINLSFFHGKWEKAPRQTQWLCAVFWPLNFICASIEYKQVEENLSESQHQCLNHHSGEKRQRKPDTKWHSFLWLRGRKRETESGRGREEMEKRHSVWLKCRYAEEFAHFFFESCEVRVSVKFWGFITQCRHLNLV